MHLTDIFAPVEADLNAVIHLIHSEILSKDSFTTQLGAHIFNVKGKLLRPAMTLLIGKALNMSDSNRLIKLAASMEILHTATLIHDDMIDKSVTRRGRPTLNSMHGNEIPVLFGDFLHSICVGMLAQIGSLELIQHVSSVIRKMCEGEIIQFYMRYNPDITQTQYFDIIDKKTSGLFSCSAYCAASLAVASQTQIQQMLEFGRHFGLAYQMLDDCKDFCADAEKEGKDVGSDLREGKLTLPTIIFLQNANEDEKSCAIELLKNQDGLTKLRKMIIDSDAMHYTGEQIIQAIDACKSSLLTLNNSIFRDSLLAMLYFLKETTEKQVLNIDSSYLPSEKQNTLQLLNTCTLQ